MDSLILQLRKKKIHTAVFRPVFRLLVGWLTAVWLLGCAPLAAEPVSLLPVATIPATATAIPSPTETAVLPKPTAPPPSETAVVPPTETPMPDPTFLTLYDFSAEETTGRWYIVNDDVMGGVSDSTAELVENGVLRFTGNVSLDNFGGFASLRAEPTTFDTDQANAIVLRVRGDGQRYHLQIRTDNRLDGVAYDQPFDTIEGEWLEVVLPIADFVPQFRGRVLNDVDPLDPANIGSIGLIISDKQAGPFQLDVAWIRARFPADG